MTPAEYELMCEAEDDLAEDVRAEHKKTGRAVREILAAMRDEGYIEATDEAIERIAKLAEKPQ
jgi:hypothetical protein